MTDQKKNTLKQKKEGLMQWNPNDDCDVLIHDQLLNPAIRKEFIRTCQKGGDSAEYILDMLTYFGCYQ